MGDVISFRYFTDQVRELVLGKRVRVWWIGASDEGNEGAFRWRASGGALPADWPRWRAGEPNDAGAGGEDCVEADAAGQWNDNSCDRTRSFVCKIASTAAAKNDD